MCQSANIILLIFGLVLSAFGFDKNINYTTIRSCKKQFQHIGRLSDLKNPPFTNFISLKSLDYWSTENEGDQDIVEMRFYFKGETDFHVLLTKNANLPEPDEKTLNIWLGWGFKHHAIYYTKEEEIFDENKRCDFKTINKKLMSKDYFTQVDIVLDKCEGILKVLVPGTMYPLLTCYDPYLKDMNYISFSGWYMVNSEYYFDCQ